MNLTSASALVIVFSLGLFKLLRHLMHKLLKFSRPFHASGLTTPFIYIYCPSLNLTVNFGPKKAVNLNSQPTEKLHFKTTGNSRRKLLYFIMNKGFLAVLVVLLVAAMIVEPSEALLRAGRRNSIYGDNTPDNANAEDLYAERLALARAAGQIKRGTSYSIQCH